MTAWKSAFGALTAALLLTACQPATATTDASKRPTHTPAPITTPAPAPTPGVLHVVHTPRTLVDDMHLTVGACHVRKAGSGQPLPDPACTPGAIDPAVTQANIKQTICATGYTSTVRPSQSVTGPAKIKSMAQYEVTGTAEYDHLVPLELGGASATSNLWPEPGPVSGNPKDSVENTLRAEVCAGKLTLTAAQQEIAADWTVAK